MTTSRKLSPAMALAQASFIADWNATDEDWRTDKRAGRAVYINNARETIQELDRLGFTIVPKPAPKARRKGAKK